MLLLIVFLFKYNSLRSTEIPQMVTAFIEVGDLQSLNQTKEVLDIKLKKNILISQHSQKEKFDILSNLIFSIDIAKKLFGDEDLVIKLFANEWSRESLSFQEPKKNFRQQLISQLKLFLTGEDFSTYEAPNAARLKDRMLTRIELKQTQFDSIFTLAIASTRDSKEFDSFLLRRIVKALDGHVKDLYVNSLTNSSVELAKLKKSSLTPSQLRYVEAVQKAYEIQLYILDIEKPASIRLIRGPDAQHIDRLTYLSLELVYSLSNMFIFCISFLLIILGAFRRPATASFGVGFRLKYH